VPPPAGPAAPYQPTVTAVRGDSGGATGLAGLGLSSDPGMWPAPPDPPTLRQPGPGRDRRASGLAWAVAAAVIIVVAVAAIIITMLHRPAPSKPTAGTGVGASASATASPPVSPSAVSASGSVPAGWVSYTDPSGFSIKVPPGWSVTSRDVDEVRFTGPMPGYVILIAWTSQPKADAFTDWQQQAAEKAQTDPTYQQIGIQRVYYRGWNAADWEFINDYDGEPTHVLDRGFVVTPGVLGYAIEIYGPVGGFAAARATLWDGLTASFEPAS
jgi:hypothetical protein